MWNYITEKTTYCTISTHHLPDQYRWKYTFCFSCFVWGGILWKTNSFCRIFSHPWIANIMERINIFKGKSVLAWRLVVPTVLNGCKSWALNAKACNRIDWCIEKFYAWWIHCHSLQKFLKIHFFFLFLLVRWFKWKKSPTLFLSSVWRLGG